MKSFTCSSLAALFSLFVAMAACFQIGFHYGVRPYRQLLSGQLSVAVTEIALSQSKVVYAVSVAGLIFALLGLVLVIWSHVRKEPVQMEGPMSPSGRHRTS